MPVFSIIIPTYNSEVTLKKCLDSIISQSFLSFEVLIMDGISKDNTIKIAEGYYDSRIKIISENDNGIYDAMNKGIEAAKGDWLYFLGSDDEFYNENVLEQINLVFQSTKKKIVYGNVIFVNGINEKENKIIYDGCFTLEKLIKCNICHQSIFYHKTIFSKKNNFKTEYILYADWDFNLRCKVKFKFEYCDIIIAYFNVLGTSCSLKDDNFYYNIIGNIANYFKWQFYKKDFSSILIKALKDQFKRRKIIITILIAIQGLIFHPKIIMSYIKRKYNVKSYMFKK